jgi:hypothetical protein
MTAGHPAQRVVLPWALAVVRTHIMANEELRVVSIYLLV